MTLNLSTMSLNDLIDLDAALKGEIAHRAGKGVVISRGCEDYECPPGGAILSDRPAIGGDRNSDEWYPTLEAANAALVAMAAGRQIDARGDGGLYLDYTCNGCSESYASTRPRT